MVYLEEILAEKNKKSAKDKFSAICIPYYYFNTKSDS